MYADETGSELLMIEIGPHRVAFQAGSVAGVDLADPAPSADLYQALGVDRAGVRERRVRVQGFGVFDLVVGPRARVVRVPDQDLQPLPSFLSGLQQTLGLVGLVPFAGTFALILDPSALEPR